MISPEDFAAFQSVLDRAKLYVLVTHVNPDGDAIGSHHLRGMRSSNA